jgi:hypothetical protein
MKKFLFVASVLFAGMSAMAQTKADDVMRLNTEQYNFGKIKQGTPVTTYFTITNISDKPLVIESSWASCGCTTPEVSKAPIAPHGTTKVKVQYNAANKGPFTKDVSVKLAGVDTPKVMKISGEVLDETSFTEYAKTPEYKKAEKARQEMEAKEGKTSKTSQKASQKASKKA